MGLTFAEQGVEAFVSVLRHNLHPYRCITLHWLRRRRFLPPKGRLTVTLGRVKHIYAHTFQLIGTLWRHQGAAWIKINKRAIGLHIFIHQSLKTVLTINVTQMSQGPLITLNRYLSALDLSAVSFCNYNIRWEAALKEKKPNAYNMCLIYSNQTHQLLPSNIETCQLTLILHCLGATYAPYSIGGQAEQRECMDDTQCCCLTYYTVMHVQQIVKKMR